MKRVDDHDEKAWAKDIPMRVAVGRHAACEKYLNDVKPLIRQCIETLVQTHADTIFVYVFRYQPIVEICGKRHVVPAIPEAESSKVADQIAAWASSLGFNAKREDYADRVRVGVEVVLPQ
jgi:hypothetical protein